MFSFIKCVTQILTKSLDCDAFPLFFELTLYILHVTIGGMLYFMSQLHFSKYISFTWYLCTRNYQERMHQRLPLSTSSEFQLPLAPIRRRGKRKSRAGRRRMNNAGNERREKRKERRGRLLIRHSFPRFFLSHEPDKKIELENETILTQTTLRFKLLKKKKKKELSPFAGDGVEWGENVNFSCRRCSVIAGDWALSSFARYFEIRAERREKWKEIPFEGWC